MSENIQPEVLGPGYFGPAHVDSEIATNATNKEMFIASLKHSLLFNPKIVLTDEMLLTENFKAAYLSDIEFQKLFRSDLIGVAHNDRIFGGRALDLVECRRFHTWLNEGQPQRLHPFDGSDLHDPFDDHLRTIQDGVERLYPDASKRDPNYTAFLDLTFQNEVVKESFGPYYSLIDAAYLELRERLKSEGHVLGSIHIDEKRKLQGTENIFDVMAQESTLLGVPRRELVDKFAPLLTKISRTLVVKAELKVLEDTHAILPADLKPVRSLTFSELDEQSISQRESNIRVEKLDLQAVSIHTMSTLTLTEILDIRKAADSFFQSIRQEHGKPESFNQIWREGKDYCRLVNHRLAFKSKTSTSSRVNSQIRMVQGALEKRKGMVHGGLAMLFQIAASVSSTLSTVAFGSGDAGAAAKVPLKAAEESLKAALSPPDLESVIRDVKASYLVSLENGKQCLLSYD